MPIINFTVEDIWEGLKGWLPWGSPNRVRNLYEDATGECGFMNPKGTEKNKVDACGARFGCWVCPVVNADKSLQEMVKHHPWLKPLDDWRTFHMILWGQFTPPTDKALTRKERSAQLRMWEEICHEVRKISKSGHQRDGKRMVEIIKHETEVEGSVRKQKKTKKDGVITTEVWYETQGEFRPDWGCMSTEARRFALRKLLEAQEEMNELRAEEDLPHYALIHQDEIDYITAKIEEDERERPYLSTGAEDIETLFYDTIKRVSEKHGISVEV
jgi:DNA sulfur modification protein DndC